MNYLKCLKGSSNPDDFVQSWKYKRAFRSEHPEFFDPDGIMVFCGPQGAGKTLSAVQYVIKLAQNYPNMILVSNVVIDDDVLGGVKRYPYTGLPSESTSESWVI